MPTSASARASSRNQLLGVADTSSWNHFWVAELEDRDGRGGGFLTYCAVEDGLTEVPAPNLLIKRTKR